MSNTIIKHELNRVLLALLGNSDLVDRWWDSPNRAFEGETPNQIYWSSDEGRQRVANYIADHVQGTYA